MSGLSYVQNKRIIYLSIYLCPTMTSGTKQSRNLRAARSLCRESTEAKCSNNPMAKHPKLSAKSNFRD